MLILLCSMQVEVSLKHEDQHVCMQLWRSHTEALRMRVEQVSQAQNADTKNYAVTLEARVLRTYSYEYVSLPAVGHGAAGTLAMSI